MNQIIQYAFINEEDASKFVTLVNDYIKKGWEPCGGPFTFTGATLSFPNQPTLRFGQAIIKKEEEKCPPSQA